MICCAGKGGGYDGVEIMGSEGYFINQFICERTNQRHDSWGGNYENRIRLPTEIVSQTRKAVEKAGATILNCGIGWHEARIPTIASAVPPGAFVQAIAKLKNEVVIPVVVTNRINSPEQALGKTLGKTTGWSHRLHLQKQGLEMIPGVQYDRIESNGIWITIANNTRFIEADNIILCAGQIEIERCSTNSKQAIPAPDYTALAER